MLVHKHVGSPDSNGCDPKGLPPGRSDPLDGRGTDLEGVRRVREQVEQDDGKHGEGSVAEDETILTYHDNSIRPQFVSTLGLAACTTLACDRNYTGLCNLPDELRWA
jgi:hypothetical protein